MQPRASLIIPICRAFMDLYQQPGIADTVNFDHIKRHYYMTHTQMNPTRIVPIGPLLDLGHPHNRERLK
jgi:putative glutathione S-transferase